jgi:hypothetical protein
MPSQQMRPRRLEIECPEALPRPGKSDCEQIKQPKYVGVGQLYADPTL